RVDGLVRAGRPAGIDDLGDRAVVDGNVDGLAVEQLRSENTHYAASLPGCPPSKRYSTAIRTATPLVTCSTMTECSSSATSALISIPRFIGPGCMTMESSGMRFRRTRLSPYLREYSRALGKKESCMRSCW